MTIGGFQTYLDPGAVIDGARRLTAAGDTLAATWQSVVARIEALHGDTPWGTDEPGTEFNKNYLAGDEPPATATLTAGGTLVERLASLGPSIREGAEGTVQADEVVASWYNQAQ